MSGPLVSPLVADRLVDRTSKVMMFSIDHGRLLAAIVRHVPGAYVRDYRANRGWLTVCRGTRSIYDHSKDTDKLATANVPAETLCSFPRGQVQATTLYSGIDLVRPGWRLQMRKLRGFISEAQARRIERDLGRRVFT